MLEYEEKINLGTIDFGWNLRYYEARKLCYVVDTILLPNPTIHFNVTYVIE